MKRPENCTGGSGAEINQISSFVLFCFISSPGVYLSRIAYSLLSAFMGLANAARMA